MAEGKFCRYCGAPSPHHKPDCPRYVPPPLIVRDVETGKLVLIKPKQVRKATWEDIRMDSLKKAVNVAYNTFVESPPRRLHPENVEKFIQFSRDLFQAQRLVGLDLEKYTREFNEELEYYMRFIKEIRGY